MSLIGWYPLDGNLEDYSGNKRHLTGDNVIISNDGKIGKCYSFDGNSSRRLYVKDFPQCSYNFTWTCWVKQTTTSASRQMIISQGRDVTNYGINITILNNDISILIGKNTGMTYTHTMVNNWTHIALVADTIKVYLYVNGLLVQSINLPEISFEHLESSDNALVIGKMAYQYTGNTNYFPFNGKINDIRIYDEALSLKEIKEIAKAKILHYNFNEYRESTKNLANFKSSTLTSGVTGGWTDEICPLTGEKVLKITRTANVTGYNGFTVPVTSYKPNTKYTYTIWCKVPQTLQQTVRIYLPEYDSSSKVIDYRHYLNLKDVTNGWVKLTCNWTSSTLMNTAPRCQIDWTSTASTQSEEIYFGGIQLEEKDHNTPYTPSTRLDYVSDCSGFKNDSNTLELTTTPQWVSGSKIGSGCYKFNKSSSVIHGKPNTFKSTSYTVSLWFNKYDNDYYQGVFQFDSNRTMRLMGFDNNYMRFHPVGLNDGGPYVEFSYATNTWYHVVMKVDGLKATLYLNGIKIKEVTLVNSIDTFNTTGVILGMDGTDTDRIFNGLIDDVIVYATALTDSDVKELYESRGSISKNGKVIVNEIIETPTGIAGSTIKKLELRSIGYNTSSLLPYVKLDGTTILTGARSYSVVTISRDLLTTSGKNFDVYNSVDNATAMINHIKSINDEDYIVIVTYDHPTQNSSHLRDYLTSLGLNYKNYTWGTRDAYAAIFRKCGDILFESHEKFVSDSTPTNITYSIDLKTGNSVNKKGQLVTNEIIEVPTVNLETKTAYSADWVQLFYHNSNNGTVLFGSNKSEFLKCNTVDKISNLYLLDLFRGKDGKFELLLEYQSGGTSYNRWKQSSNFTSEPISGYEAIQCSWTANSWGGLEYNGGSSSWADGSVNISTWHYSIGQKVPYSNSTGVSGIPHWSSAEPGWVKLWVRCDNPEVFKFYKNGCTQATEFIEI